ncbi:MAG: flagellin [Rhodothermales bacterium]|nr:flagellin [Rhodothermales bacterium]
MSLGDLSRINTNVQSMQALGQLNKTNSQLGVRQMRLATGSRLNRAEDDSAGYTISNKLQAKTRGQAQALANIGDAKGMLTVGEGALNSTMDILQTMKEKAVQAANDTLGEDERGAIQTQIDALTKEIGDTLKGAEFNGKALFGGDDGGGALDLTFQVGASKEDTFGVNIGAMDVETLGVGDVADADVAAVAATGTIQNINEDTGTDLAAGDFTNIDVSGYTGDADFTYAFTVEAGTNANTFKLTYDDANGDAQEIDNLADTGATVTVDGASFDFNGDLAVDDTFEFAVTAATDAVEEGDVSSALDVTTLSGAQNAIDTIDAAIKNVNTAVSGLGDAQARLSIKQDNLDTSMTNYEAARSRIEDADFAKEQMEIVKLQILQQTGISSLAQANSGPQSVLSLIG